MRQSFTLEQTQKMPEPYTGTNANTTIKMFHARDFTQGQIQKSGRVLHWRKIQLPLENASLTLAQTRRTYYGKDVSWQRLDTGTTSEKWQSLTLAQNTTATRKWQSLTLAQTRLPLENVRVLHWRKRDVHTTEKMFHGKDFTQGQTPKDGRVLH